MNVERVGVWIFNEDRNAIICKDLYESSQRTHSAGEMLTEERHLNEKIRETEAA